MMNQKSELNHLGHVKSKCKHRKIEKRVQSQSVVLEFCDDKTIKKHKWELYCRKQLFLLQLDQILNQGKIDYHMAKIESWIDDNIDTLYYNKYPEMKKCKCTNHFLSK